MNFVETIAALKRAGYPDSRVEEKLAQDIVLKAIGESGLRAQITIKGGVVMAALTKDIRRTTLDLDIDFVRYSLSDESIDEMVRRMNCLSGITIRRVGDIVGLKQPDYFGKRIYLSLQDEAGYALQYKLDIGVHANESIAQTDFEFDLSQVGLSSVVLQTNSPEQIFVEKLKSLLRLGTISSRGKDVFDMVYLSNIVDRERLQMLVAESIYKDEKMFERTGVDIVRRLQRIFSDQQFISLLKNRRLNWLQLSPEEATAGLLAFVRERVS